MSQVRAWRQAERAARVGAWVGAAHVELERRVAVGHQRGVGDDPQHPPVHPEHEVEHRLRVASGDGHDDRRDQHEDADQPAVRGQGDEQQVRLQRGGGEQVL